MALKYCHEGLYAAEGFFCQEFKREWLIPDSELMPGLVVQYIQKGDVYLGILPNFWDNFQATENLATFLSNILHSNIFSKKMSEEEMMQHYAVVCPNELDAMALKRHSLQSHADRFLTCTQILPGVFRETTEEPGGVKITLAYIPEPLRDHRYQTLVGGMGDIMQIYGTTCLPAEELSWPLTRKKFQEICPSHPYFHGARMHPSAVEKMKNQHDLNLLGRVQWNFYGILRKTSLQAQYDPADKFFQDQQGQLRDQLEDIQDVWNGISAPLVIALNAPVEDHTLSDAVQDHALPDPVDPVEATAEITCSLFGSSQGPSQGSWPPPDDETLFSNDPWPHSP